MSSVDYIVDMNCSLFAILERLYVVFSHLDDSLCRVIVPVKALALYHVIVAVMLVQQFRSGEVKAIDACDDICRYRKESCVVEKLCTDSSVPQVESSNVESYQTTRKKPEPRLHFELDQFYQLLFLHVLKGIMVEPVSMVWIEKNLQVYFVKPIAFLLLSIKNALDFEPV